jgi:hypothetical protein
MQQNLRHALPVADCAVPVLATLLPIDAGQARVFGLDVAHEPHRVRQLVGVTGQYASVESAGDDRLLARRPSRVTSLGTRIPSAT